MKETELFNINIHIHFKNGRVKIIPNVIQIIKHNNHGSTYLEIITPKHDYEYSYYIYYLSKIKEIKFIKRGLEK